MTWGWTQTLIEPINSVNVITQWDDIVQQLISSHEVQQNNNGKKKISLFTSMAKVHTRFISEFPVDGRALSCACSTGCKGSGFSALTVIMKFSVPPPLVYRSGEVHLSHRTLLPSIKGSGRGRSLGQLLFLLGVTWALCRASPGRKGQIYGSLVFLGMAIDA